MGVIRKSNITNPFSDSIEDVLDDIENGEQNQEPEVRRRRKIKHRVNKLLGIGSISSTSGKSGRKKKRGENSNYLLSLADPEELPELSIEDFIPQNASVFTQMLIHKDNAELWNEFMNCTTDYEDWYMKNFEVQDIDGRPNESVEANYDWRSEHPAYAASHCFHKIDGDLRYMLKKKHVPMGALMHLEQELVTFFVNRPQSIYHCEIPSSFERLMVHALSQYMDLCSLSYNRSGSRWTRVRNKKTSFILPAVLLSSLLEKRSTHTVH